MTENTVTFCRELNTLFIRPEQQRYLRTGESRQKVNGLSSIQLFNSMLLNSDTSSRDFSGRHIHRPSRGKSNVHAVNVRRKLSHTIGSKAFEDKKKLCCKDFGFYSSKQVGNTNTGRKQRIIYITYLHKSI